MTVPLPIGFGVVLDADTRQLDLTTMFGGSPARVLRLSPAGEGAWHELEGGAVRSRAGGRLARQLTDAGMAHPRPPTDPAAFGVTVVIPVRDRAGLLDRCLTAVGTGRPIVVVDDGSVDAGDIAETVRRHGAHLVRRASSGGPAAARNAGLAASTSAIVAFLDSDCTPPAGWIERLIPHFADPLVGAVAARIVPETAAGFAGRYAEAFSCLDLGAREARVVPGARVAYVPTAALLLRREALEQVTATGHVLDPALRHGEDVDLVWRLHKAGWRIRYEPSVQVRHREPESWPVLLGRRFRYGTSAAPLARRHPDAVHPLWLHPWPTTTVVALLSGRLVLAACAVAASVAARTAMLRREKIPTKGLTTARLGGGWQTWLGLGRYLCQFASPVLVTALVLPGRRHRWRRRAAIASLLLCPACTPARASGVPIVTRVLGRLADDVAYGAGVWAGCLRHGTLRALVPAVSWRRLRASAKPPTSPERRSG